MIEGNPPPATTASRTRRPSLPGGLDPQVVALLMLVVLSFAAFLFWYWDRTAKRSAVPMQGSAAVHRQQAASVPATLPISAANAAPVASAAASERPVAPATTLQEVQPATQPVAVVQAGASPPVTDGIITETDTASAADEDPREELIVTDSRRSTRATRPRTDGAAAPRRLNAQGPRGTARTGGVNRHCDRYNPFGEAIC